MKRPQTLASLALVFSLVLVSCIQIGGVKAQGTIYINEDGTIEGTDKIQRNENVYTLTDDINSTISVLKDDVVLDGAGHGIRGPPTGVVLPHRNNVTVQNFTIATSSTSDDICLRYCTNCTIQNNILTRFGDQYPNTGISVWGGGFNVIAENQIVNNSGGIFLGEATCNNSIISNSITNNTRGIQIQRSQNNSIYGNSFNNRLTEIHILAGPAGATLAIQFDNGTSGNYWDKYRGTDPDGDGVGNTPYFIDDDYLDEYPLMEQVIVIPEFASVGFLVAGVFVVTLLTKFFRKGITQVRKR
jgi:parallel beta-helix repeat protein